MLKSNYLAQRKTSHGKVFTIMIGKNCILFTGKDNHSSCKNSQRVITLLILRWLTILWAKCFWFTTQLWWQELQVKSYFSKYMRMKIQVSENGFSMIPYNAEGRCITSKAMLESRLLLMKKYTFTWSIGKLWFHSCKMWCSTICNVIRWCLGRK